MNFGSFFIAVMVATGVVSAGRPSRFDPDRRAIEGGAEVVRNLRLTAATGAIVFVLLAGVGITILRIRQLLPEHLFLGLLVIPPVILKMASTGYRFVRYYAGDELYRKVGPPGLLLRLIAPALVISTIAVFATGVELWTFGLRFGSVWITAHTLSFVVWSVLLGIHLIGYFRTGFEAALEEVTERSSGASTRRSWIVGSVVLGAAVAAASLLYRSPIEFFG